MKRLVLTATIGGGRPFSEFTVDSQRKYADRIGAEFVHVTEFDISDEYDFPIGRRSNKGYLVKCLVIQEYFKEYDRIVWLDDTCVVAKDCPDLFQSVPEEMFGAHNEGILDWVAAQTQTINLFNKNGLPRNTTTKQEYFNSGVMVLTKEHHEILFKKETIIKFGEAGYWANGYPDQTHLNYTLKYFQKGLYALPHLFNRMVLAPTITGDKCANYSNYTGMELSLAKGVSNHNWITEQTTKAGQPHHAYIYHITSFYPTDKRTSIIKRLWNLRTL